MGAPECFRHMGQWQMTPRIGDEMARYRTAPQRQPPSNTAVSLMVRSGIEEVVCRMAAWPGRWVSEQSLKDQNPAAILHAAGEGPLCRAMAPWNRQKCARADGCPDRHRQFPPPLHRLLQNVYWPMGSRISCRSTLFFRGRTRSLGQSPRLTSTGSVPV